MDLWIRSQDKEALAKISNVQYSFINNTHYIGTYYDNLEILGTYKTKERALEVLDEIQNAILGIITLEEIEKQEVKNYTGIATISQKSENIVYEMPKD